MKDRLLDTVGEGESGMIWQNGIETYTLPYVKQIVSGNLLCDPGNPKPILCDNLEGWDGGGGGREVQEGGTYIYLWLIHAEVWQKPPHYCKVIILQLKTKFIKD